MDVYTQNSTPHFPSNELNHWEFIAKVVVLSRRQLGICGACPNSFFYKPVLDQGPAWWVGKKKKTSEVIAVSNLRVSQAPYSAHGLSLPNTFISISRGAVLKKKMASVEFGAASISRSVKTRIFRSHIKFEHPVMAGFRFVNWWTREILQKTKFLLVLPQ